MEPTTDPWATPQVRRAIWAVDRFSRTFGNMIRVHPPKAKHRWPQLLRSLTSHRLHTFLAKVWQNSWFDVWSVLLDNQEVDHDAYVLCVRCELADAFKIAQVSTAKQKQWQSFWLTKKNEAWESSWIAGRATSTLLWWNMKTLIISDSGTVTQTKRKWCTETLSCLRISYSFQLGWTTVALLSVACQGHFIPTPPADTHIIIVLFNNLIFD